MGQESAVCSKFDDDCSTALAMPTTMDSMASQQTDIYCQPMVKLVHGKDTRFTIGENELIFQSVPIDCLLQIIVPEALCQTVLYNGHHSNTAGQLGTRRVYDSLRRLFCWPHIASNVYNYVEKRELCRRHRPSQKRQLWMQLFPPSRPLEIVAEDILGPLKKKVEGTVPQS